MTDTTTTTTKQGRRIFCKSDDSAPAVSKKISMAALPDSHNGFPVRVFSKRKIAVNTAVKACAIATNRLSSTNDMEIVCIPSFRDNRNEVSLFINQGDEYKKKATTDNDDDDEPQQFNIGAKTDIKIAAGAIANAARQSENLVKLQAIGQDAVFNAIRAVAVAREYLDDKDDNVDIFCSILFTQVRLDGREEDTTAIQITCYYHEGRIVNADGSVAYTGGENKPSKKPVDTSTDMATEES